MRTALVLTAALLATPLAARPPAAAGPPRFDPARFEQEMAAARARRADDIAIVLALKPAQRPALDQWLAAMTPPAPHDPEGPPPHGRDAAATTPERLDRAATRLADRQRRESAGIAATRQFYASLDPQQQRVFDALDRLRRESGPHHGFGRHDRGAPEDRPRAAVRGG